MMKKKQKSAASEQAAAAVPSPETEEIERKIERKPAIIAKHDRAHCLTPGLFRSLKRGERKKLKLDITYTYGDGEIIQFRGPEPLGADDLRVLQGLVAMGGARGVVLQQDDKSTKGQQLRHFLDLKWDAIDRDTMVIKGSFRHLAREVGYSDFGNSQFKTIKASIERLNEVTIYIEKDGKRWSSRILLGYASDEREGKLFIALNPRLAEAIMEKRQYTCIDMAEVRGLQTDPTRIIHQRLCGWIDPGTAKEIEIDTLCGYVWPDEAAAEAMRKRRQTVKKALTELSNVGWTVRELTKGKFTIIRRYVPQEAY
jgi:hypothetical protein